MLDKVDINLISIRNKIDYNKWHCSAKLSFLFIQKQSRYDLDDGDCFLD